MTEKIKVVCLGGENTFTGTAARKYFQGQECEFLGEPLVKRVIKKVECGEANFGVIPLENLYNGEVIESLNELAKSESVLMIGETWSEIVHCLGALKERREIRQIYSKDQALQQCSDWIDKNYSNASLISTDNTEAAAKNIKENNLINAAAIASEKAILKAGLEIISKNLVEHNRTRFAIIGKNIPEKTSDDKTFIVLHPLIRDKAGVLTHCCQIISNHNINMEYFQSRPDKSKGYLFYIELVGHKEDEKVNLALKELKEYLRETNTKTDPIKLIGSYKNSHWKE